MPPIGERRWMWMGHPSLSHGGGGRMRGTRTGGIQIDATAPVHHNHDMRLTVNLEPDLYAVAVSSRRRRTAASARPSPGSCAGGCRVRRAGTLPSCLARRNCGFCTDYGRVTMRGPRRSATVAGDQAAAAESPRVEQSVSRARSTVRSAAGAQAPGGGRGHGAARLAAGGGLAAGAGRAGHAHAQARSGVGPDAAADGDAPGRECRPCGDGGARASVAAHGDGTVHSPPAAGRSAAGVPAPVSEVHPELAQLTVPVPMLAAYDALVEGSC